MTPALSIVLPCYNEAANLPRIFARFTEVLNGRGDVEVILVNNGSRDDSARVLAAELAKPGHAFARVVEVPVNRGYGFGIMAGVRETRGTVIAWTHADLQTDPADVLLGYDRMMQEPDPARVLLKGRRQGRPALDALFTLGMSVIASAALGERVSDVNAQPKMFHREFLGWMKDAPDDFALDLYVLHLARLRGLRLLEQPVRFGRREHGESKGGGTLRGKWRLSVRTWKYIARLRRETRRGAAGG